MTSVVRDKEQHLPDNFSVPISDIQCLPDIGSAQKLSGCGHRKSEISFY
jgi:hypothetical protein